MGMCPYCGEEVPEDSGRCWKCGTELGEGGSAQGDDGDDLAVPDEDDGDSKPQLAECPHCGSPINKKQSRCKECGRTLKAVKANRSAQIWKTGIWLLVVGVGLAVATTVVFLSIKRKRNVDRSNAITATYVDVFQKVQPLATRTNEERRQQIWTKEFQQKFVKWGNAVVVGKSLEPLELKLAHTKGKKEAEVLVSFLEESREAIEGLKVDDTVGYSARLVDFGKDGVAFTLTEGMLDKEGK